MKSTAAGLMMTKYELPQNFLVTGGCGFLGVNLIARLVEMGCCKIRVVDNLSVGSKESLGAVCDFIETDEPVPDLDKVELWVGDITDADFASRAADGMKCVIHLAANTGVVPSIENPLTDCENNVIGTLNYLEAARRNGAEKFIFASSGAPLGEQKPPIDEEKVPRPISPYGASKLAGEGYCSAYYGSFGLKTITLRFGNVYGPRSNHKGSVVAKFIKQALRGEPLVIYGDGNQTRDFIYVDDLIDAILSAAARADIGGEIFQIATHKETTVNEVAIILKTIIEAKTDMTVSLTHADARTGEIKRNFSDISKARRLLGWEPSWTLENGLTATVEWFLSQSGRISSNEQ